MACAAIVRKTKGTKINIIAIDPGANGGNARLRNGEFKLWPMPSTELDLVELLGSLIGNVTEEPCIVYLEQVGGFTGGPSPGSAMFKFGWWASGPAWIALCYQARLVMITPQKWQKEMGCGTRETKGSAGTTKWKNKLKAMAQRLHPELGITLKTADALLILEAALKLEKI